MKKEIEAFVNAANEQELEAAWNNLSAEEQRVFEQLMEEDSPEDALAFFAQLYDDAPKEQTSETVSISENEIYFKRKPLTEEQKKHGSYVDENGNLHVKNLSAFWIPELTTTEKVGHTTYTVRCRRLGYLPALASLGKKCVAFLSCFYYIKHISVHYICLNWFSK